MAKIGERTQLMRQTIYNSTGEKRRGKPRRVKNKSAEKSRGSIKKLSKHTITY